MILAIDPGNEETGFVLITDDLTRVVVKGKWANDDLLAWLKAVDLKDVISCEELEHVAIEMVASYGMPVGATVFETCVWIGRFYELIVDKFHIEPTFIYRKDEKINLCNSMKAKDSNIRQALIDRFGEVGTKKNPGYFYGFKKDIWAAMAVAVTYHDMYMVSEDF